MKPLAANSLLQNRYLIIHHIGKGGMGEVYLAVDQRLGNPVALKRTVFRDDAMMWDAFEREARILARLRHPVLPKVSDHFSEMEEQYLVMEYISGDDLSKRLEAAKKPFPLQWVLYWADELLDALNYLHTHEPPIIHRDIKPQNLKLTNDNHVVLLDFGLAKSSVAKKSLSSSGSLVGYTPHYAPIEQVRGAGTNPRSDIYSLSSTLYQLMTGTVPMDALTRAESVIGGMGDPLPSPREMVPDISEEISAVILRGMSLNSEQRYPNAKEMQRALREAYSRLQASGEAAEPFDGTETLVPETRPDAPLISVVSNSAPAVSNREKAPVFAHVPEPPETLTADVLNVGPDMSATIPVDQWASGETVGFSHQEIRRSTIDEDAFRQLGFDADETQRLDFTGNGVAPFGPFDASLEPEPEEEEVVERPIDEYGMADRPAPIRPVSKPLDVTAKPVKAKKASSGWGIRLVGIAAVLCLMVAVAAGGVWYAITAKLMDMPAFLQEKPAVQQPQPQHEAAAPDNTDGKDSTATTTLQSAPDEKEATSDLGAGEEPVNQSGENRTGAGDKKVRNNVPAAKGDKQSKGEKPQKQVKKNDIMQ
jgi:serine/threonine protein kinase